MGPAVLVADVVLRDEGEAQVLPLGGGADVFVAALGVQLQQEVQARVFLADADLPRQGGLPQLGQELVPQGPVVVAHAVDVLFKIALGQEPGQRHLLQAGDGAGIKAQGVIESGDQVLGQDQVADAEGRGQALGKGVDIDHFFHHVDALQGRDGPPGQTELTVVVVLDDIAVLALGGPAQKLIPAADRHDDARGEMVRGGDVQNFCAALLQFLRDDAVLVHGDVVGGHVVLFINFTQAQVAGVFHGIAPLAAQELDENAVQILRPRAHHDLLRVDGHAPELIQMV